MSAEDGVQTRRGGAVYPQVARAIEKLGRDIAFARRARRIPAVDFARRMGVSRMTLHRLENGDSGATLNTLSMALHVLGRLNMLAELADLATDDVGLMMARQATPSRSYPPRDGRTARAVEPEDQTTDPHPDADPAPDENGYVGW